MTSTSNPAARTWSTQPVQQPQSGSFVTTIFGKLPVAEAAPAETRDGSGHEPGKQCPPADREAGAHG
jgi:hypothetical protein